MQQSVRDPLTVVIVGGVGAMGRHAVRAIVRLGSAKRIVIADINIERASQFAAEIGDLAEPLQLDASDESAMRAAFADCDVVLNTMGPFAHFGGPVLRAALEAGCDYLDIDDDWDATVEALEFDELARRQGCRAVIGVGASPGTTNLCATLAAGSLDSVEDLFTGWTLEMATSEPEAAYPSTGQVSAAAKHWLLQCTETIRTWENGQAADVKPLQPVAFDFPGIGPVQPYTMGHPEPITLPRSLPGLTRVLNLQSTSSPDLFDHFRKVAAEYEAGRVTLDEGARLLAQFPDLDGGPMDTPLPPVYAVARGVKDGRARTVAVYPRAELPGGLGGNTGIPLAIGLELLRRGAAETPGLHAAETAFDPTQYFQLYGQFLETSVESIEDVLIVATSSNEA
ncbi:saccharopine dehydrogenase family protein [Rhodococcus sp. LB1]|uniref:saccharopine dehydrogenase family protein n=1 Tax=Rhodococcus sp. LB1 TaxID=1807499 RepID=UPI000AC7284F|nr:saccharopine dehydrogenase NADP-binding domain-containing protein [Rhodococcus sp. LB1]